MKTAHKRKAFHQSPGAEDDLRISRPSADDTLDETLVALFCSR